MEQNIAMLSCQGRYTKFTFKNRTITFLHGKDLLAYTRVKSWDEGLLVVDCVGRVKKTFEDYIDLNYILSILRMNPEQYLEGLQGVIIQDEQDGTDKRNC